MPTRRPFTTRPLHLDDRAAETMARRSGSHGVYVRNALAAGEGEGVWVREAERERVLCWFGPRGNLVVLDDGAELDAAVTTAVVEAIGVARMPWRIVMGPTPVVDELRGRVAGKPLVHRDQVYYAGTAVDAAGPDGSVAVRTAERADRDRLVQATLQLNHADLSIDPAHVDRRWLRDTIDERIAEGSTRVVGPPGSPYCKLDFGSDGPGGAVIEGVFTFPEHRGRGLATALVAACLRAAPGHVCLHVGRHNAPARAAYERAGMRVAGGCRLLLLG
ncbi:MAG: GNAT family N-acetyltransferase [Planctomycetes bacterium]|nr:GNAT family N-acetyltransferase [Planctomycetota bacterium]